MTSELIPFSKLTKLVIQKWQAFSSKNSIYASPFFQFEFAQAVHKSQGNVYVLVRYSAQTIDSILVLQKQSILAGLGYQWQRLGGEMSDYFSPISEGSRILRLNSCLENSSVSYLNYSHLLMNHGEKYPGQIELATQINIADGADAYFEWLHSTNKKFYKDTLRRERKCELEKGTLVYRYQDTTINLIDKLIEKKREQYQRTGVKDSLSEVWKINLLKELVSKHQDENSSFRCVLSSLTCGDDWIAYHVGIQANGILQYWFPVYNPSFQNYAPGRLLLFATIRAAETHGIRLIDRGAGMSDAKKDMANVIHRMGKHFYQEKHINLGRAT